MNHTIEMFCEEDGTTVELDLTDAEHALLQRVAAALNADAGQVGPWLRIDGTIP